MKLRCFGFAPFLIFAQISGGGVPMHIDFESEVGGRAPAGFTVARTGGGTESQWLVREETGAPSGRKALVQTSADPTKYRFPVCVHDRILAADVDASVRFKAISGTADQAAGIVWRYTDPDNYYVVRANALEGNVVLYRIENGKRSDLKPIGATWFAYGKDVQVVTGTWNQLAVTARGRRFSVSLNGTHLFDVEDGTFGAAGKVGLWTKADSVTAFDDFVVSEADVRR